MVLLHTFGKVKRKKLLKTKNKKIIPSKNQFKNTIL